MQDSLFIQLLNALPQTQCTRCGYPDCAAYAQAIASGAAPINQCPPGGAQGVERLAAITGQPILALNPEFGGEAPRKVAFIDEAWCIGCTLCLDVCPTDAIVGSNKRMHTVIEAHCTGCELCLPVCPVDCILTENVSGSATGWDAWSQPLAEQSRQRYCAHQQRQQQEKEKNVLEKENELQHTMEHLEQHSKITDSTLLDKKRAMIEAALARAKSRNAAKPTL